MELLSVGDGSEKLEKNFNPLISSAKCEGFGWIDWASQQAIGRVVRDSKGPAEKASGNEEAATQTLAIGGGKNQWMDKYESTNRDSLEVNWAIS